MAITDIRPPRCSPHCTRCNLHQRYNLPPDRSSPQIAITTETHEELNQTTLKAVLERWRCAHQDEPFNGSYA
jgi:hypothetical protein